MQKIWLTLLFEEVFGSYNHVKNRNRLKELESVMTRVAIDQNSTSRQIMYFFRMCWI